MNTKYTLEITSCPSGNHVVVSGSPDLVDACFNGMRSPFRRFKVGENSSGKAFVKVSCLKGETSESLCKNIVRGLSNVIGLRGRDYCNGGNF